LQHFTSPYSFRSPRTGSIRIETQHGVANYRFRCWVRSRSRTPPRG
jgi:hypothetical protein